MVVVTLFVSLCLLYYINRKTTLRRRALRERAAERREHMLELLQKTMKNDRKEL